ncbi:MAG: T9SS type A sorting domain-containing protein [Sphingobacteriales bacterium]|nr:MAG: T9SS type A sorting domain-containing protein [Sphingobacteriales bacterium]
MKSIPILLCFAGLATLARAQVYTGTTGLTVKSGTTFVYKGLNLTPSADLSVQNQTISRSATPATAGSGATISRVYTISPALTFSGALGIRYAAGELNGNQEGTLSLVTGTAGNFAAFNSSTPGTAGTYYVSVSGLNNVVLGSLSATSASVPLSIRYNDFAVVSGLGCTSLLSWNAYKATTANFTVERSADGKRFEALASEVWQNDHRFNSTDPAPLKDRNFYRLAIREPGEEIAYSNVISINNSCLLSQTRVYPNPAGKEISISLATAPVSVVYIDLLDLSGKVVLSSRTSAQISTLDLQSVAAGIYLLKIQNGTDIEPIKLIKQ